MKKTGALSSVDVMVSEMEMLISRIRYYRSYAELQSAYGQMVVTMGIDAVPEIYGAMSTEELADEIEKSFSKIDHKTIHALMKAIRIQAGTRKHKTTKKVATKKEKTIALPPLDYFGIEKEGSGHE